MPAHKKNALILGIILMIALCASLLALFLMSKSQRGRHLTALIYQSGNLLYSIDLNEVTEAYELTVTGPDGRSNTISVRPGSIAITEANCPDKLCVHMGYRDSALLPITCLPNEVVIRLVPGGVGSDDAGSGGAGNAGNGSPSGSGTTESDGGWLPGEKEDETGLDGVTY